MKRTSLVVRLALMAVAAALTVRLFLPPPEAPVEVKPFVFHVIGRSNSDAPSFAPPSLQTFAALVERPIFTPTRKPLPESTKKDTPNAPPPPPSAILAGIIVSGDERLAVLRRPGAGPAESLPVGGALEGWTIAEIAADHLTVKAGTFEQEIRLQAPTGNAFGNGSSSGSNMVGRP